MALKLKSSYIKLETGLGPVCADWAYDAQLDEPGDGHITLAYGHNPAFSSDIAELFVRAIGTKGDAGELEAFVEKSFRSTDLIVKIRSDNLGNAQHNFYDNAEHCRGHPDHKGSTAFVDDLHQKRRLHVTLGSSSNRNVIETIASMFAFERGLGEFRYANIPIRADKLVEVLKFSDETTNVRTLHDWHHGDNTARNVELIDFNLKVLSKLRSVIASLANGTSVSAMDGNPMEQAMDHAEILNRLLFGRIDLDYKKIEDTWIVKHVNDDNRGIPIALGLFEPNMTSFSSYGKFVHSLARAIARSAAVGETLDEGAKVFLTSVGCSAFI